MGKRQQLFELAASQSGYFTAKQAVQVGFSRRMHTYYKQNCLWLEINRGLFRLVQFPHSSNEDYVRLSLWSRNRADEPQAVFSHDSALAIHELSDVMPAQFHITVPLGFRKTIPKGCVFYKDAISPDEKELREGFFVTTPLRTIVDSAESHLSIDYLEQAIQEACDKGMIQLIDILSAEMSTKARAKIMMIVKNMRARNGYGK